jgi:hypothetical protein
MSSIGGFDPSRKHCLADAGLGLDAGLAHIAAWWRPAGSQMADAARRSPFGHPNPQGGEPSRLESSNILGIRGSGTM